MSIKYPVYPYSNSDNVPNSAKTDWVNNIIDRNNKKFFKVEQPYYVMNSAPPDAVTKYYNSLLAFSKNVLSEYSSSIWIVVENVMGNRGKHIYNKEFPTLISKNLYYSDCIQVRVFPKTQSLHTTLKKLGKTMPKTYKEWEDIKKDFYDIMCEDDKAYKDEPLYIRIWCRPVQLDPEFVKEYLDEAKRKHDEDVSNNLVKRFERCLVYKSIITNLDYNTPFNPEDYPMESRALYGLETTFSCSKSCHDKLNEIRNKYKNLSTKDYTDNMMEEAKKLIRENESYPDSLSFNLEGFEQLSDGEESDNSFCEFEELYAGPTTSTSTSDLEDSNYFSEECPF